MSFILNQQRKRLLQKRLLQKQEQPTATTTSSDDSVPAANRVYWRDHQSEGYDPRLQWREGENGQFYYDSRQGTRSFTQPQEFLTVAEASRVIDEIEATTGQTVSSVQAARIFSSSLGETDGEGVRSYARGIAQQHGGDPREYINRIEEKADEIRRDTLSSLRDDGIYTTSYVNANPPVERDDDDDAVEQPPEEEEVQRLSSMEVRDLLRDDVIVGHTIPLVNPIHDGDVYDMFLSTPILNHMMTAYHNDSSPMPDFDDATPMTLGGGWTEEQLVGFTRYFNNYIKSRMDSLGNSTIRVMVNNITQHSQDEWFVPGATEEDVHEAIKATMVELYGMLDEEGRGVANRINRPSAGLPPEVKIAWAVWNANQDDNVYPNRNMTAYIQRKTKEIMEGKGVEGISNEEYENLNQFGKDMLSQNEMILGSTMSQITKHLHENGAMVVLTDVGDLVYPAEYNALNGVAGNGHLPVKVPSSQVGTPLRANREIPRGLYVDAKAAAEVSGGTPATEETFLEWVQRESEGMERNMARATRRAERNLRDTGSTLSPRLNNFATGEVRNAVGVITAYDNSWLTNNLSHVRGKATEWTKFWSHGSGPIFRSLNKAIQPVLNKMKTERPDDYNKWSRGWEFAYGQIDNAYRDLERGSVYEPRVIVTDKFGGVAATGDYYLSGASMSVGHAGTHPLYMPQYPYEQMVQALEEEADRTGNVNINRALRSLRNMRPLQKDQRGQRGIQLNTAPGAHLFAQFARVFLESDAKTITTSPLSDSVKMEYRKAGMSHPNGAITGTRLHMIRYLLKTLPDYVPLQEDSTNPITKQVDYLLLELDEFLEGDDEDMEELDPTAFTPLMTEENTKKKKK